MRYLVFSDIHSNLEAFQTLLQETSQENIDVYLFLGDLVGYGASPNEVISLFHSIKGKKIYIRGNHDKVIAGIESPHHFNPVAAASAKWSSLVLDKKYREFLYNLHEGPKNVDEEICICHGAPFDEDSYLFSIYEASKAFAFMDRPICFFGHTHYPSIFILHKNKKFSCIPLEKDVVLNLNKDERYMINPGSIGQPRDRNPNPSYIIYETETKKMYFKRFSYNINKAQSRIIEENLPEMLARRLSLGI